jgi:hypothetical protein
MSVAEIETVCQSASFRTNINEGLKVDWAGNILCRAAEM